MIFLKKVNKNNAFGLIGVGQIKTNLIRKKLFSELKKMKIKPATIISKNSVISKVLKLAVEQL